jgi:hypothetical protein
LPTWVERRAKDNIDETRFGTRKLNEFKAARLQQLQRCLVHQQIEAWAAFH